jgi:anti-sigma factor RsiW
MEMSPLSEKDRADLVAYLDGELDEQESRALEARLSLDPSARAEAESLRKTWELLDYLPRAEPSPTFTNRTLEKLAVRHTTGVQPGSRRRPLPWWLVGAGWAAAMVVAAAVGLGLAHLLWSSDASGGREAEVEEAMKRHPRVIEHQRAYEPIDNLEYLRGLATPDLFGDEEVGS